MFIGRLFSRTHLRVPIRFSHKIHLKQNVKVYSSIVPTLFSLSKSKPVLQTRKHVTKTQHVSRQDQKTTEDLNWALENLKPPPEEVIDRNSQDFNLGPLEDYLKTDPELKKEYESFLKKTPSEKELAKARWSMDSGRYIEALKTFKNVLNLGLKTWDVYEDIGMCFIYIRQFNEAKISLKKAQSLNPDSVNVYISLGAIEIEMGNQEKALEYLRKSLTIDPDSPTSLLLISRAYSLMDGQLDEAAIWGQMYVDKQPNNFEGLTHLGEVYLRQGKLNLGIACYEKASAIQPNDLEVLQVLSRYYLKEGRAVEAISELEKIFQLDPDDTESSNLLAALYNETGQVERAETLFKQNTLKNPNDYQTLFFLASFYLARGDQSSAEEYFKLAIKAKPEDPTAYFHLAEVLVLQGRNQEAEKYWFMVEKLYRENPDSPIFKQLLEEKRDLLTQISDQTELLKLMDNEAPNPVGSNDPIEFVRVGSNSDRQITSETEIPEVKESVQPIERDVSYYFKDPIDQQKPVVRPLLDVNMSSISATTASVEKSKMSKMSKKEKSEVNLNRLGKFETRFNNPLPRQPHDISDLYDKDPTTLEDFNSVNKYKSPLKSQAKKLKSNVPTKPPKPTFKNEDFYGAKGLHKGVKKGKEFGKKFSNYDD